MSVGCEPEPGLSTCAQTRTRTNVNIRPRPLAQRTGKENLRKRERWKETIRQRDKERKREGREKERQRRERKKSGPPSDFQQSFLSLKKRSSALRIMAFDVATLESMLRDALDEVSGLETMLVTAIFLQSFQFQKVFL